jgi:hypothetical protein
VHYGLANEVVSKRDEVLMVVFKENSRRFKGKALCVVKPPAKVWINLPIDIAETSAPEWSGQGLPDSSDMQSWRTSAFALPHQRYEALL